jgi:UDP-N-acetyl-D-glucosamine dehydrogenase
LKDQGATVDYFDPFVHIIPKTREHAALTGQKSIDWSGEQLTKYDASLICTDHDNVNYEELVTKSKLIIDTRNATALINNKLGKIIKA